MQIPGHQEEKGHVEHVDHVVAEFYLAMPVHNQEYSDPLDNIK